jgi:integrase
MTTFLESARQCLDSAYVRPQTLHQLEWLLAKLEALYDKDVGKITSPQVLNLVRAIETAGQRETAHRVNRLACRVLQYAIAAGDRKDEMGVPAFAGILKPVVTRSHAAIVDPAELGTLLRAIDGIDGSPPVRMALRLAPHLFVRPSEIRGMAWTELDFEKAEWRIPGERMKMRRPHLVPLSPYVLGLLERARPNAESPYVFYGRNANAISENAMANGLRRLGYTGDKHTVHGFRSTASTLLHENGFDGPLIELQLAHAKGDRVARIYDRSQRLDERRTMMGWWSAYLEQLRGSEPVEWE